MLSKVVMLLTETELRDWRNGMVAKGLKLSSANRIGKSFKAALALAAKRDKRISQRRRMEERPEAAEGEGQQRPAARQLLSARRHGPRHRARMHVEDSDFGALIEVLAGTGVRNRRRSSCGPTTCRTTTPTRRA